MRKGSKPNSQESPVVGYFLETESEVSEFILLIWGYSSNLIRPAKGFLRLLNNFYNRTVFQKIHSFMLFWPSEESVWPLIASITSEVKNDHVHVTTQRILNKFIEANFSAGCLVWPCLFRPLTTSKIINKIQIEIGLHLFQGLFLFWSPVLKKELDFSGVFINIIFL